MGFQLHWVCSSDIFMLFIVLLISVIMFLYRKSSKWPPSPLTNWPFFGMTPYVLLNAHRLHDFATDILKLTHGTFLFKGPWFANMDMLITSDPANIHHILSKNFHNYPKGPDFRRIFDILGDGIFNSDDELWELHRKTTMSILKHPDFHSLLEVTIRNKVDKGLLPLLHHFCSHRQETDLQEIFQRLTFDTICLLLLDYDPESLSLHLPLIPCEKAFTDVEEALLWRHVWPEYFWKLQRRFGKGKEKKMKESWKAFDEFIYNCLSRKEDHRWLLRSLMRGFEGQGGSSGDSRKFLKDAIMNLMIAGRDTTSTGLSWFLYLLAKNPRVEDKIREEIEKQLGGRKWEGSLVGAKELEGMVYLHGGLCEALRLYPPVAFEHKSPLKREVLPSGDEVDEKTKIILSFYSMGRMEWIWGDDCMEFKPERWFISDKIKGNIIIKHEASYKFTAFHAGPRRCLGKEMGLIQMKMVAAALIYHYHVELVEGHQVCPSDSIILQMKYGLKVRSSYVNSPAYVRRSTANKAARAKQTIVVRTGSKSLAQARYQNRDPVTHEPPSLIEEYARLRSYKGQICPPEAAHNYARMKQLKDAQVGVPNPLSEEDIMEAVLGPRRGWQRGIGPKLPQSLHSSSSGSQSSQRMYTQSEVEQMLSQMESRMMAYTAPLYKALNMEPVTIHDDEDGEEEDDEEEGEEEDDEDEFGEHLDSD